MHVKLGEGGWGGGGVSAKESMKINVPSCPDQYGTYDINAVLQSTMGVCSALPSTCRLCTTQTVL